MDQIPSDSGKWVARAGARHLHLGWGAAGLILGLLAGSMAAWLIMRPVAPPLPMRFVLTLPRTAPLASMGHPLTFSRDGFRLVYTAQIGDSTQLYLRNLDEVDPKPVAGSAGAHSPFLSPDGSWIGYFDARDSRLKKVPASGGDFQALCRADFGLGASWGADGTIIFSPDVFSGLWRIPAAGGKAEPLTQLQQQEFTHRWPQILPDGKSVIFTVGTAGIPNAMSLAALTLKTGKRKVLLEGASDSWLAPSGYLFFMSRSDLMAVRFNPARLEVEGKPFLVQPGIAADISTGAGHYALAPAGMLAYAPAGKDDDLRSLVWVDRQGVQERLTVNRGAFSYPRLSPDGRLLAIVIETMEGKSNIWIAEAASGVFRRLPTEGDTIFPVWTPDSKKICFASDRLGRWQIFLMPIDGNAAPEPLYQSDNPVAPNSWSPDGRFLAFTEFSSETGPDLWILSLEGRRSARLFLRTPYAEWGGAFSPDARWLAYTSNDTGLAQVYVQPFPSLGERIQISTAEGREPVWSRDGRELFFRCWNGLMGVNIPMGAAFDLEPPRLVAAGEYETGDIAVFPNYDVSPDGNRFVLIPREQRERRLLNIEINCLENRR
jgi:Tol biopolymer transport system component